MKMTFAFCALIAFGSQIAMVQVSVDDARAQNIAEPQRPETGKGDQLAALEKMLLGTWDGPACGGDFTFNPDGTYELTSFTPGNNTLTGTWELRWDAIPPTLVLTCKTSDLKKKDPTRQEYEYLGKAQAVKVLELNKDGLFLRFLNGKGEADWEHRSEKRKLPPE